MKYRDFAAKVNPEIYTTGRGGNTVRLLVCHNTAGPNDRNNIDEAVATRLTTLAANFLADNTAPASVHWLIGAEKAGAPIYRLVPEEHTAYHAGGLNRQPSKWTDPKPKKAYSGFGVNQVSIGIELLGQPKEPIGANQRQALEQLVQDITSRNPILVEDPQNRIVAHGAIDPNRTDGFNWVELARAVAGKAVDLIPIQYKVVVPRGVAVVRQGPGRSFAMVKSVGADETSSYQVEGEKHGEPIPDRTEPSGFDDVWSYLPELGGYITRTALLVVG